ncbi:MAG: Polyketide cyclase / dehydrase and lipid transport [Methanoregula sp. PtaU1.Bin051]|nr:MAG: Polyketide cyclase / dehydrase and lipid transport [Methanoregula sp. PtaU1.Bin051]
MGLGSSGNPAMVLEREITVNAPPETVWNVLAGIAEWPAWNPGVSSVTIGDNLTVGTHFRWRAKGIQISSTVTELIIGRRICWTGNSVGIHAMHLWTFEPVGGRTRVTTREALSGWLVKILTVFRPAFLDRSLEKTLAALKARAEKDAESNQHTPQ